MYKNNKKLKIRIKDGKTRIKMGIIKRYFSKFIYS